MVKVVVNNKKDSNFTTFENLKVGDFFTFFEGICKGDVFLKTSKEYTKPNCMGVKFTSFEYGQLYTQPPTSKVILIPDVTITVNMD